MSAPAEHASFLGRLVEGRTLPPGCDTWGIKSVRPDGRTHGGYQWPLTPKIVKASNVDKTNTEACPAREGDGLCAAWNHRGMSSGGIPARTLLLLAFHSRDVLGTDDCAGKCRVAKVRVVDVIDGERALKEHGRSAYLRGSDLRGLDLRGSDLRGSNLRGSNLSGSDLRGAYLRGSDLRGAYLRGSDLSGSNLRGANLYGANLYGSDLSGSNLRGSNLSGLNLSGSNLSGSNLSGSNLSGSNLSGSNLRGADLRGANHDETTVWPNGQKPAGVS